MNMLLGDCLKGIDHEIRGAGDPDITSICYDSRKAEKGCLFFCITGFETDGHRYAPMAEEKGAAAIVVTRFLDGIGIPQVKVPDDRKAMALISENFYGKPYEKLTVIGITGTKGKTSTSYMVKSILEKAGHKTGLIGTISYMIGDKVIPAAHTTPEAPELQKMLREMLDDGADSVVMEVSSSALVFDRVYGMHFDAGVYTNLSQDHLDIHKDFEHYAKAKQMLFGISGKSIINTDDAWSGTMKEGVKGELLTYSLMGDADFAAKDIRLDVSGTEFTLGWNGNEKKIDLMIPGRFMVYNALAAAAACLSLGVDIEDVASGILDVKGVAGRFEKLDTKGRDFSVILDYAHTPDSLKNILESVRHFSKGRVVCLFGCGGNRDRAKRPKMGEITEELADLAIVTTDNPRFEEPGDIINEILSGMKKDNHVVIENRLEAIKYALDNARKDDIIILAGKGHEYYQEIKGIRYHFNEKEIVDELLD